MTFWSRYIFGYWSFCILMLLLLWLLHFGHGTFFGHWSFCILMLLVLWLLHFGHGCYWYYDVVGFMTFYY